VPFDAAGRALAEFVQQLAPEAVPAVAGTDEQVVQPDSGTCLPGGEVPAAEREPGDLVRFPRWRRDDDPRLRIRPEQVPAHLRAVELQVVVFLVYGVFLDERADLFHVLEDGVANGHQPSSLFFSCMWSSRSGPSQLLPTLASGVRDFAEVRGRSPSGRFLSVVVVSVAIGK